MTELPTRNPHPPRGSWRAKLKTRLRESSPRLFLTLRRLRRMGRDAPLDAETRRIVKRLCGASLRVVAGPLAGTLYIDGSASGLLPKLAGCYEAELHPAVREIVASRPRRIVVVGSGEGYYAAGLARAISAASVKAYDTDPLARERLSRMAALNGLSSRIETRSACTHVLLQEDLQAGGVVISDCEGFERELLDPNLVPGLRSADLLVEVHDFVDPTISATLAKRFASTHCVRWIEPSAEEAARALPGWSPSDRERLIYEGRTDNTRWAWMTPLRSDDRRHAI